MSAKNTAAGGGKSAKNAAVQGARRAEQGALPWVERLARLGYAAKGIVYIIIGLLALDAARGSGSANVNQKSAFGAIVSQPFGQFLLIIVAVGLAGYALWRLIEAIFDPERDGRKKDGALKRVGYFATAVGYALLAAAAYKVALGRNTSSGNPSDFTASAMSHPWGRWLVILAGLIVLVVGLSQIYQAYKASFERRFNWQQLSAEQKRWIIRLGRFGYFAKGLVYAVVGVFLVQAGWQHNPQKAGGLGDALVALQRQPMGTWVLAVVAIGLLAYGAYALFLSQYRRIALT